MKKKKMMKYLGLVHKKISWSDILSISALLSFTLYILTIVDINLDKIKIIKSIHTTIQFTDKVSYWELIVIGGGALLVKSNLLKVIKFPLITWLDIILLTILTICIELLFMPMSSEIKMSIIGMLILVLLVIMYRVQRVNVLPLNESVGIELKDINNNNNVFERGMILKENAVSYDLLNRGEIIASIATIIEESKSNDRIVIGINGAWGSGKTTIIQNTLVRITKVSKHSHSRIVIIDNFDPWLLDNKKAIVEKLLSNILVKAELGLTNGKISRIIKIIATVIFGESNRFSGLAKVWEKEEYQDTLNGIELLLQSQNKKLVVVIDDLDRVISENLLFILNVVNNVLCFNNLVVILSYDYDTVENELNELGIGSGYLDKIVQQEIRVPLPEADDLFHLFFNTLVKLSQFYVIKNEQTLRSELTVFSSILVADNCDLRQFKRYFNSELLSNKWMFGHLDFFDVVVLLYIRFRYFDVYTQVLENEDILISINSALDIEEEELTKRLDTFFKQHSSHKNILNLLGLILPFEKIFEKRRNKDDVTKGFNGYYGDVTQYSLKKIIYNKTQHRRRLANGIYFSSYFYITPQAKEMVVQETDKYIQQLNVNNMNVNELMDLLSEYPEEYFLISLDIIRQSVEQHKLKGEVEISLIRKLIRKTWLTKKVGDTVSNCKELINTLIISLSYPEFKQIWHMFSNSVNLWLIAPDIVESLRNSIYSDTVTVRKRNRNRKKKELELKINYLNKMTASIMMSIFKNKKINILGYSNYRIGLLREMKEKLKGNTNELRGYVEWLLKFNENIPFVLEEAVIDYNSELELSNIFPGQENYTLDKTILSFIGEDSLQMLANNEEINKSKFDMQTLATAILNLDDNEEKIDESRRVSVISENDSQLVIEFYDIKKKKRGRY